MKREEVINKIEDAWVLQELLYDLDAFNDDELFDKTLSVIHSNFYTLTAISTL